jgi:hypothetical protein
VADIREGIHRAALGARQWNEPLITEAETFDLGGPVRKDDIRAAADTVAV